jgi:2'-5' RNA ligase
MQTCVVAYPELAPADRAWIELLRERHDPNFRLVAPHWTLIFPTAATEPAAIERHVTEVAAGFAPFAFDLRCALVVRDAFSALTHLFLVPDAGFSQLVRLHDGLYGGVLADQLRLDVPFIPHITIGAFDDAHACKAVADRLNQGSLAISGRVERLSILAVEPERVTLDGTIPLGAAEANHDDSQE